MSNKEIWYKSNKYLGRDFIIAGIILIIGSLFLLIPSNGFSIEEMVGIHLFPFVFPITFPLLDFLHQFNNTLGPLMVNMAVRCKK